MFAAFQDAHDNIKEREHVAFQSETDGPHLIRDDDESVSNQHSQDDDASIAPIRPDYRSEETREEVINDFFTTEEPPQPAHVIDDDEENLTATTPQAELLRWHYCLGHASFKKIKLLAMLGILPRRLASVENPKCAGCLYGAMTKKP